VRLMVSSNHAASAAARSAIICMPVDGFESKSESRGYIAISEGQLSTTTGSQTKTKREHDKSQ
jgi:hypothetical protein